jgi:gluconate 5-dehydrogenase
MQIERFSLSKKVALVTGAGGRLGQAFCEALAEAGADVVCVGRHEDTIKKTAELISEFGHETLSIRADVTIPEDVERAVRETLLRFGKLDIAVNNAGGPLNKLYRLHEMPLKDWENVIAVNLTGTFLCMCEEIKAMLRQRRGSIINISSVLGIVGVVSESSRPQANYAASKHGIIGLTRQGALEYARDNIRINAIAPGWFPGKMAGLAARNPEATPEEYQRQADRRIASNPMGRAAEMDEIKGQIIYLASDASSYVTGQVLAIDGGYTAQ